VELGPKRLDDLFPVVMSRKAPTLGETYAVFGVELSVKKLALPRKGYYFGKHEGRGQYVV